MNNINMSNNIHYQSIEFSAAEMENDVMAFYKTPLSALSKRSLHQLSLLLNSTTNSRSGDGYEGDWRGLASLSKQRHICYENVKGGDPTAKVIQLWYANSPKTATFAKLQLFLSIIERRDVADEMLEYLVQDTKAYQKNFHSQQHLNCNIENIEDNTADFDGSFDYSSAQNLLTTSDVMRAQQGLSFQMYDGFVLYDDGDINNVAEILTHVEDNPQYNFNFCMKNRDLLRGVQFDHNKLTQLIEERCKTLIVILTEEFLNSPEYGFLLNYAQAQQLQNKTRNIITLLYGESVNPPTFLNIYTQLRYLPAEESVFNFYSKLAVTIQNINGTTNTTTPSSSYNRNINNRSLTLNSQENSILKHQANNMPSPPIEIPAMNKNTKRNRNWLSDMVNNVFCHKNS